MPSHLRLFSCVLRGSPLLWGVVSLLTTSAMAQRWMPLPEPSTAEARLEVASSRIERELAQIDSLAKAQAWDESIDALLRLANESPDELVRVTSDYYLPLRQVRHLRIAHWAVAARGLYRDRVGDLAQAAWSKASASQAAGDYQFVVDHYYNSLWGDDALLALGELALERGNYATARGYWQQILPALSAPDGRPWGVVLRKNDFKKPKLVAQISQQLTKPAHLPAQLTYPDSTMQVADLLARLAIVSIREGHLERAEVEVELLRRFYPKAVGRIAGREVPLAATVASTLASALAWPARYGKSEWPTLGGNNRRGPTAPPLGDLTQLVWSYEIPHPSQPQLANLPCIEPAVAQGRVAFRQQGLLHALQLKTGEPLYGGSTVIYRDQITPASDRLFGNENPLDARELLRLQIQLQLQGLAANQGGPLQPLGIRRVGSRPLGGHSRHLSLLTLRGSHLYATLGPSSEQGKPKAAGNRLPAIPLPSMRVLDLAAEGKLVLEIPPAEGCRWSGPPVVDGDRIYLPMRQREAGERLLVGCYSRSTGLPLWRTAVCSFLRGSHGESDLLTVGDQHVYLQTNAGVIVALQKKEGHLAWARTYPRRASTYPNDLSMVKPRQAEPCLLAGGTLVSAPADASGLMAFDPTTGRTLWTNEAPFDVEHLLGVVKGRLVATGRRLWILDVATGEPLHVWPASLTAGISGTGRGCLAGDELFWPTEKAIYTYSVKTGQPTRPPMPISQRLQKKKGPAHQKQEGNGQNRQASFRANLLPLGQQLLVATPSRILLLGSTSPPAE